MHYRAKRKTIFHPSTKKAWFLGWCLPPVRQPCTTNLRSQPRRGTSRRQHAWRRKWMITLISGYFCYNFPKQTFAFLWPVTRLLPNCQRVKYSEYDRNNIQIQHGDYCPSGSWMCWKWERKPEGNQLNYKPIMIKEKVFSSVVLSKECASPKSFSGKKMASLQQLESISEVCYEVIRRNQWLPARNKRGKKKTGSH